MYTFLEGMGTAWVNAKKQNKNQRFVNNTDKIAAAIKDPVECFFLVQSSVGFFSLR